MSMSFEQAMRLAGLHPRDVVADSKWRRCATDDHPKKRNGAYRLDVDGRRGWWRNWAIDDGLNTWVDDKASQARPIDPAMLERRRLKERQDRLQGIGWARKLWAESAPYRPHRYLADKGLSAQGCQMLRLWQGSVWVDEGNRVDDTWLIVPLYWRDKLVNVQRISGTGIKRQMKQAPVRGCSLILGQPRAAVTVITEGLATGLSVYQSMRHARVIVAFFADNLLPVVQLVKPTGSVVIAADNDHATLKKRGFNPGLEKAQNAADLIGCGVAYPEGIEGTDWADWLIQVGDNAARQMERLILAKAKYVDGVWP